MYAWTHDPRSVLRQLTILSLVVLLTSGCGIFSPDDSNEGGGGGGGGVDFPPASTPDQLLTNFTNAYEQLLITEYEKALHADFVFWFAQGETGVPLNWDRAADIASTEAMFGGELGQRPGSGEVVPAVQSIDLSFSPQEGWRQDFEDGEEFAEADFRGVFDVFMDVRYTDSEIVSQVRGLQRFYIKQVTVDGQEVYEIYAWQDLGNPNS